MYDLNIHFCILTARASVANSLADVLRQAAYFAIFRVAAGVVRASYLYSISDTGRANAADTAAKKDKTWGSRDALC